MWVMCSLTQSYVFSNRSIPLSCTLWTVMLVRNTLDPFGIELKQSFWSVWMIRVLFSLMQHGLNSFYCLEFNRIEDICCYLIAFAGWWLYKPIYSREHDLLVGFADATQFDSVCWLNLYIVDGKKSYYFLKCLLVCVLSDFRKYHDDRDIIFCSRQYKRTL